MGTTTWARRVALAALTALPLAGAGCGTPHATGGPLSAATEHALAASESRAAQALTTSARFASAYQGYLPPTFVSRMDGWRQQFERSTTPDTFDRLAQTVTTQTAATRAQAQAARAATPVGQRELLDLRGTVAAALGAVTPSVEQAVAEHTPGSPAESATRRALAAAAGAAQTVDPLLAVQQQAQALATTVAADLAANRCGHPVPAGHVISLDLGAQEVVFYEDGCAVRATPATSGRPELRTPVGTFAILARYSPFVFHSMWPPGSPFWYPTSPVSYAMEFAQGGYFLHDAPWEPDSEMGPGSEDGSGASHGCVHIPLEVMSWVYSWAPIGTPFIVSG